MDEDLSRFGRNGRHPGWWTFDVDARTAEEDLAFLSEFGNHKIIPRLKTDGPYRSNGFKPDAINEIEPFTRFRGLEICNQFVDLSFVRNAPQLEVLDIFELIDEGGSFKTKQKHKLDLSQIPNLTALRLPTSRTRFEKYKFEDCTSLEYLFLGGHYRCGEKLGDTLAKLVNLRDLSLHRPKFNSLDGIEKFTKLKTLELDYTRSLVDISAIENLEHLEMIQLQNCPNIESFDALFNLRKLRALQAIKCGSIASLEATSHLRKTLEYLHLWDTNILDGNTSSLLEFSNLKYANFNDKRHYNTKQETVYDNSIANWPGQHRSVDPYSYVYESNIVYSPEYGGSFLANGVPLRGPDDKIVSSHFH